MQANKIDQFKTFIVYSDPGHAWLAAPKSYLDFLGINSKISSYSYVSPSGGTVYLEEDMDAGIFMNAWLAKFGFKPLMKIRYSNSSSKIRNNFRYTKQESR